MKTIIAATDYSATAAKSVAFAAELARHFNAGLILYNAFRPPISTGQMPVPVLVTESLIRSNNRKLKELADKISERYKVRAEAVSSTSATSGLKKLVHQKQADLVVIGMRSNTFWTQTFFGNFTNSLLRKADFPVMIIPEEALFQKLKKILFACDIRKLTAGTPLPFLKALALSFNASIQVLQVVKKEKVPVLAGGPPLVPPNMESVFRGVKHSYRQMEAQDVAEGIENGILEYEAELLVMVPHAPGFLDAFFLSGHTPEMASRTSIPLLVLPQHAQVPA